MKAQRRSETSARALQLARAAMPQLGITRLTDTTRLDRLGVPVFACIRPRGQVLRVHAGKGLTPDDAAIGALMEAIEFAVADPAATPWRGEQLRLDEWLAPWGGRLAAHHFPRAMGPAHDLPASLLTVEVEDLMSHRRGPLPAELVFFPRHDPQGPPCWGATTTGLAAACTLEDATLHGLLEVLERDALSMNLAMDASAWVWPHSLPEPYRGWQQQWQSQGVELAVRHVPNAFGLPCFQAWIHEPNDQAVDLAGGSGLHLHAEAALGRAICEAAQSRLSTIHGGRDDVSVFYAQLGRRRARAAALKAQLAVAFDERRSVDFRDLPPAPPRLLKAAAAATAVQALCRHLATLGFHQVLRYRFAADLPSLHVLKVIVPQCEDVEHGSQRVGARLRARWMLNTAGPIRV